MPLYERADREACQLGAELIEKEPNLREVAIAKPRIDYLFAFAKVDKKTGEKKGVAIKHHGLRALALVRVNPLKRRVLGLGDVEIMIDKDHWEKAPPRERKAILHHELYHLASLDDTDDIGRPKFTIRHHDFEFGWFNAIAKQYGQASIERKQAAEIRELAGQFYWPDLVKPATAGNPKIAKFEVAS